MGSFFKKYIGDLFLTRRFYMLLGGISVVFLIRFYVEQLGLLPWLLLSGGITIISTDYILLFLSGKGKVTGERICPARLSNGDENKIVITIRNDYGFTVRVWIIDEIPFQFQKRDVNFYTTLSSGGVKDISYSLRPVKRGEYEFGTVKGYIMSPLHWLQRRFILEEERLVKVYPSYLQLRKYQLMAQTNRWSQSGIRKIRQLGHSMEFEQIKEYVRGDDYRTVNWQATARAGRLMVNNFTEEKSQQIYCIIDKGRVMKMPFEGLSLLDYSINASLVLSNVGLNKQDKAGIITFSERMGSFLPADRKTSQMQSVMETLYKEKTRYLESDFERLYVTIRKNISQRSLLILFTNFETLSGLNRQLPYLQKIARHHLLLVVFFENTELKQLAEDPAEDIERIYTRVIAEKFAYEKRQIVKELQQSGILAILSAPEHVTVDTLNKYLELKARQAI